MGKRGRSLGSTHALSPNSSLGLIELIICRPVRVAEKQRIYFRAIVTDFESQLVRHPWSPISNLILPTAIDVSFERILCDFMEPRAELVVPAVLRELDG